MEDFLSLIHQPIQPRTSKYDEWFLHQGRYDHGPEFNQRWVAEIEQVRNALILFRPGGHVLELACGAGLWVQQLLNYARHITAVNATHEVITLNEQ